MHPPAANRTKMKVGRLKEDGPRTVSAIGIETKPRMMTYIFVNEDLGKGKGDYVEKFLVKESFHVKVLFFEG